MKNATNTNLKIGFGLSILFLVISSVVSYICIDRLLSSSATVQHTNEVTRTIERTLSDIQAAETAQRGFLITNNTVHLDSFETALNEADRNLRQVLQLTRDNPAQQEMGHTLREALERRIGRMKIMIELKRQEGVVHEGDIEVGRAYMEEVRSLANQMILEENALLQARTATRDRFAFFTPIVIVLAAFCAILVAVVFYIRIVKDISERRALHVALEAKDQEIQKRLEVIQGIASQISSGDYAIRINDAEKDTLGSLSVALNRMADSLASSFDKLQHNEWLQSGVAALNEKMVGERQVEEICNDIVNFLADYTGSKVGAVYLLEGDVLRLQCGYALPQGRSHLIQLGEGIAGQCVVNKKEIVLGDVPEKSFDITHATGRIRPRGVIAFPIFHDRNVIGVIELARLKPYCERDLEFLNVASQNIGTAIHGAQSRKQLQELLEETQAQSEELQAQHSELENLNAELEAHTLKLQASEEELRVQQEELQQNNLELEERNHMIRERNAEIMKKAKELELSTQYKTEFMANMSHELRTPLNSILLLSRYLAENSENNLTEDQKESASVIYNSGNGLLRLIDELLDLSKIEAGKMDLEYRSVRVVEVLHTMESLFLPVATEKNLDFVINNALDADTSIEVDEMKLEQILKNLLSNAMKFTEQGQVELSVTASEQGPNWLEFSIADTGIGIQDDKLGQIFEAFTQADGSTKRKYGGTGLGLSISRQLARLLGGEITVVSKPDKGSTFTLILPINKPSSPAALPSAPTGEKEGDAMPKQSSSRHVVDIIPPPVPDDRDLLEPDDKVILIIEDDTAFAKVLLKFTREQHYKGIVSVRGDEAIILAQRYRPRAILLDIQLPVKDGWEVMDDLKTNPQTRHIPVHVMSSLEVKRESRMQGAVDFFNKPLAVEHMHEMFKKLEHALSKNSKKVLIVEENAKHAEALAYFLETFHISATVKHSIDESIESLKDNEADCVILDMGVPDRNAYDTLETVKRNPGLEDLPIIVFTGKNLSHAEETRIKQYADSIVVKTAHSYQRIIDEVAIFLHMIETQNDQGTETEKLRTLKDILHEKTVLVADDDVRNVFSITKALEKHRMHVISAIDGEEALEKLAQHPETDIVLMDMMMPQLDGYETTAKIRQHAQFNSLPVIAVTAKAMLGDREKCIAAGASDYISKPIDLDQLISLLRVWLYDKRA